MQTTNSDGSGAAQIDSIDRELRENFRLPGGMPDLELVRGKTALVIIDMQILDAHREGEFGRRARDAGILERTDWYFSRIENQVSPAIARMLSSSRDIGIDVVYTRIAALTTDGRDLGWRYQHWGMTAGVDDHEAEILPEVAPIDGEIVVNKTTTSAFMGSHIDRILRNLGSETLVICGVLTSGCVESTVRDAADAGYRVIVPEDATSALSEQAHRNSINAMHPVFATVTTSDIVLEKMEALRTQERVVVPAKLPA